MPEDTKKDRRKRKIMSRKSRRRHNSGKNRSVRRRKPLTKKAKILIIAAIAAAVVLIILAVWWVSAGSPLPGSSGANNQTAETGESEQGDSDKENGGATDSDGEGTGEDGGASGSGNGNSAAQGSGTGRSAGADGGEQNMREEMTLPYTVPGTDLIIDAVDSYSGVFIEDGSDEEVSNIFAIHVKNEGENVEYSSINLEVDGKELNFTISDLPSGAAVSVLENSRTAYSDGTPVYRGNQTAYIDKFDMMSSEVGIVIGDDNGMTVTNLTDEKIPCLRIFYKFAQDDEYLGGITYTAKIDGLDAGDSITIYPSHFSKEGSKVMMVRTYETTE